jgi:hypothetical protein
MLQAHHRILYPKLLELFMVAASGKSAICYLSFAISFEALARMTLSHSSLLRESRGEVESGDLPSQNIPGFNSAMSGDNLQGGPTVDGIKSRMFRIRIIPNLNRPSERSLHSKRRERP